MEAMLNALSRVCNTRVENRTLTTSLICYNIQNTFCSTDMVRYLTGLCKGLVTCDATNVDIVLQLL